jgi:hypothetical protein
VLRAEQEISRLSAYRKPNKAMQDDLSAWRAKLKQAHVDLSHALREA